MKELLGLLNKALAMEYSAAIQYRQHAEIITGAVAEPLMNRLEDSANDELKHARELSGLIGDYLLEVPGVDVAPVKELTAGAKLETILQTNIASELEAIAVYKDILKLLYENELTDDIAPIYERLEHDIRHILMEEQGHIAELKRISAA